MVVRRPLSELHLTCVMSRDFWPVTVFQRPLLKEPAIPICYDIYVRCVIFVADE